MTNQYQPNPQFPTNDALQSAAAWNDPKFQERLSNAAPWLNIGPWKLGYNQSALTADDINTIGQATGKSPYSLLGDSGAFGKWGAMDTANKYTLAGVQANQAMASQKQQFNTTQALAENANARQQEDRKMQYGFDMNLNKENIAARSNEIEQQGKLNLRQAMVNSATDGRTFRMYR